MQGLPAGDRLYQDGQGEVDAGQSDVGLLHPCRRAEHLRHAGRNGPAGPGADVRGQGRTDRLHQSFCHLPGSGKIQEEEMKGAEP